MARSRARARLNWVSQGQRCGRCRVRRRAERVSCPVFPGAKRVIHHAFENPDRPGMSEVELTEVFRRARDEIGSFSRRLLAEELAGAAGPARQP